MEALAGIILLISFAILLILKVPIAFAIAISAFLAMMTILSMDFSIFVVAQNMVTSIDSFSLLAIPFFIIAGTVMVRAGIAQKLINLAKVLAGRMPGSLLQANILGNLFFGAISGSSIASAVAIGGAIRPSQEEEGYDMKIAAACNISSASLGLLIPPTGMFIIFSVLTGGTSIAALFFAAYIPGLLWAIGCMIIAFYYAKKYNMPVSEKLPWKQRFKVFFEAIPALMLVVIIMGGILTGIFTATEAAGIAVVYAIILALFVYRTVKLKELFNIFLEGGMMTAVVMFLVAASSVMSWVLAFTGIPVAISNWMLGITDNPTALIIMFNVFLLIAGAFMDVTPKLLLFTPIFFPVAQSIGMDPVHFGVVIVMNFTISSMTPPVGNLLMVGSKIANLEIEETLKPIMPFLIMRIAVMFLVAFIPALALFLPRLFGAM